MSSCIDNSVPVETNTVRDFGGSLYVLIPKMIRQEETLSAGDKIQFRRTAGSSDTILRKVDEPKTAN